MWIKNCDRRLLDISTSNVIEIVTPFASDSAYRIRWVNSDGTLTHPLLDDLTEAEAELWMRRIVGDLMRLGVFLDDFGGGG